jgi:hypothetical protein
MMTNQPEEFGTLRALLRTGRPEAEPLPGFRDGVWRRVARMQPGNRADSPARLWQLVGLLLQPRRALAMAGVMLVIGGMLGALDRHRRADSLARARYVDLVAPQVIR